jgi:hypothetical protein
MSSKSDVLLASLITLVAAASLADAKDLKTISALDR